MLDNLKIIAIIPARMASTRLPGKPLADVSGKPLIQRVWDSASNSLLIDRVIIATDDHAIFNICLEFTPNVVMTSPDHQSGSDRIMEAYRLLNENAEIVVNIQGDEPLLKGQLIDDLLINFIKSGADVGTLIQKISLPDQINDPSIVKVALNTNMTAKTFSRTPFPDSDIHWKHIGVYAYKIDVLKQFVALPLSRLEISERLEQMRLIEAGSVFYCLPTDAELIGVDTPDDLKKVRDIFQSSQNDI